MKFNSLQFILIVSNTVFRGFAQYLSRTSWFPQRQKSENQGTTNRYELRRQMSSFYDNPIVYQWKKHFSSDEATVPYRLVRGMRKNNLNKPAHTMREAIKRYQKAQGWRYKLIKGTDMHLMDIFKGRCWEYQKRFAFKEIVDCTKLWQAFLAGFAYREPCDVTLEDYNGFFNMIHEGPLVNKSMMWSGSREIAHELSKFNSRYTTLEDTFAGYLLDGMQWCGMKKNPGVNYNFCPYECAKQKAFWGAAAEKMARRSEGIVYAVLNGTRQHWSDKQIFSAYLTDGYMARSQIPNLDPKKVTEVRIMVGHSLHRKILERCGIYSIRVLQEQLELQGIQSSCIDDPLSIRDLLCMDHPEDETCQFKVTSLMK